MPHYGERHTVPVAAAPAGPGGEAFPVGSVFIAVVSTNPGTLLGYGVWAAFGAGRVLVGYDAGDTDFNAAEKTGGAKTVASAGSVAAPTFTGNPLANHDHGIGTFVAANESAHTHGVTSNVAVGNHTFTQPTISWPAGVPTAANESAHTHSVTSNVTVADHASHTHSVTSNVTVDDHASHTHTLSLATTRFGSGTTAYAPSTLGGTTLAAGTSSVNTGNPSATQTHTVTNNAVTSGNPSATLTHTPTNNAVTSGAGSSHTHTISWPAGVPTATLGAVDAHSVTNNLVTSAAGSSHAHTLSGTSGASSAGTPSGSVSAPAFTGSATSVVQSYITAYFWKRTA